MNNKSFLITKLKGCIFPKFSEIQYFTLISATLMMFVFSAAARGDTKTVMLGYIGQADNIGESMWVLFITAGLGVMLIIAPVVMALKSVLSKPLSKNNRGFVALIHYSLYGLLALTSLGFYASIQRATLFDKINHYFTLYMLVLIVIRWFVIVSMDRRRSAFIDDLITDRLYHYSHFLLSLAASAAIMYRLSDIYSNVAVLIFLTTGYTLFLLKIYDVLFGTALLTMNLKNR